MVVSVLVYFCLMKLLSHFVVAHLIRNESGKDYLVRATTMLVVQSRELSKTTSNLLDAPSNRFSLAKEDMTIPVTLKLGEKQWII